MIYKTQMQLVKDLKLLIDKYWELEISTEELFEQIRDIERLNKDLLYVDGDYTIAIKQRLGAKRIRVVDKVLKQEENKYED